MATTSKYRSDYPETVRKLALLGMTDEQMAAELGISVRTFHRHKRKYPEFAEALALGKGVADSEVAASLYQRACGYTTPDGHHVPADVTACIYWLKNRQPRRWRDRIEFHEEHSFSKADRKELDKIYAEALAEAEEQRIEMQKRRERLMFKYGAEPGERPLELLPYQPQDVDTP